MDGKGCAGCAGCVVRGAVGGGTDVVTGEADEHI